MKKSISKANEKPTLKPQNKIPQVKISKEIFGDNAIVIQALLNNLIISNRTKKEAK